ATLTGCRPVRAGSSRVPVTTAAGRAAPPRPIQRTVGDVAIPSGSLTTLVVADTSSGGLALRAITDAVGAGRRPGGPVPAGGGGGGAAPARPPGGAAGARAGGAAPVGAVP